MQVRHLCSKELVIFQFLRFAGVPAKTFLFEAVLGDSGQEQQQAIFFKLQG